MAALAATYVLVGYRVQSGYVSDFDQSWDGARVLLRGGNPYAEIGPDAKSFPAEFPLFYPLPSLLAAVVVSGFALATARIIFAAASAFSFTYLLLRRGTFRWPALLSAAFIYSLSLVQYSSFLACAFMSPAFGWVTACKPNMGIPVLASARTSRWLATSLAGALVLVAASFVFRPTWPHDWLQALRVGRHFRPYVFRPGGVLMLLALVRWRRPEARWLAVLSVMPGTPGLGESLVLFAATRSRLESTLLALGTYAALFSTLPFSRFKTFEAYVDRNALAVLGFVYLPALIAIVRRPNEGEVPAWLERGMSFAYGRLFNLRRPRPG